MFAALLFPANGWAQAPEAQPSSPATAHAAAPQLTSLRVSEPIRVDGRLDEEVWSRATPATEFTQVNPDEGQPASERTEVRILFDDEAIYIGHVSGIVTPSPRGWLAVTSGPSRTG